MSNAAKYVPSGPDLQKFLSRLAAVGCPVDYQDIATGGAAGRVSHKPPVRIATKPPSCGANLFALDTGETGLVLRIRVEADARTSFASFGLERDASPVAVTWVNPCAAHGGYCLHCVDGPLTLNSDVLNDFAFRLKFLDSNKGRHGALPSATMQVGDAHEGYLVGKTPEKLGGEAGRENVWLVYTDAMGAQYKFPITLKAKSSTQEEKYSNRNSEATRTSRVPRE